MSQYQIYHRNGGIIKHKRLLLLRTLLLLQVVVYGFAPTECRVLRMSRLYQSDIGHTTDAKKTGSSRRRSRVREILYLLQTRTGPNNDVNDVEVRKLHPEWFKTRNYLYRRRDLTASQVVEVVEFLENSKHGIDSLSYSPRRFTHTFAADQFRTTESLSNRLYK